LLFFDVSLIITVAPMLPPFPVIHASKYWCNKVVFSRSARRILRGHHSRRHFSRLKISMRDIRRESSCFEAAMSAEFAGQRPAICDAAGRSRGDHECTASFYRGASL